VADHGQLRIDLGLVGDEAAMTPAIDVHGGDSV
jgi:hypothetical protein